MKDSRRDPDTYLLYCSGLVLFFFTVINVNMDWWNNPSAFESTSRNWETECIDVESLPDEVFEKHWEDDDETYNCKNLLIGVGPAASIFLEQQFPVRVKTGVISRKNKKELDADNINDPTFTLYRATLSDAEKSIFLLVCHVDIESEFCGEFVDIVFSKVVPNQVSVFSTISDISISPIFPGVSPSWLRYLSTSPSSSNSESEENKIPLLESPVVLGQLPASLLTYCKLNKEIEGGEIFVSLECFNRLDERTISAFERGLAYRFNDDSLTHKVLRSSAGDISYSGHLSKLASTISYERLYL